VVEIGMVAHLPKKAGNFELSSDV